MKNKAFNALDHMLFGMKTGYQPKKMGLTIALERDMAQELVSDLSREIKTLMLGMIPINIELGDPFEYRNVQIRIVPID